jgi:hypothetical protein
VEAGSVLLVVGREQLSWLGRGEAERTRADIVRVLRTVAPFSSLPPGALEALAAEFQKRPREFAAGEALARQVRPYY